MTNLSIIRITLKVGIITGGLMVLYQLSDLLLVYRYFRYEYYIVAIAVFALIAGVVLANKYHQEKALELLTHLTQKHSRNRV